MSYSRTKHSVIQHHLSNDLLQAPALPPMPRSPDRDLSADHPTQTPDLSIIQRATAALEQGQTHYVDVPGIAPLRDALALYLQRMGLADYQQANVVVTAGIQESRFLTIQVIGEIFGCIALPEVVHPGALQAAGVRRINVTRLPVDHKKGFLPTLSSIRAALESGCRLCYLESPVRLTGATFDNTEMHEIAELLAAHDAAAIWDQGMAPWVADSGYASLGAQSGMASRVAVLGEAWPGVGLESWFIGYVGASTEWVERIRTQKQILSICTSTASQFGGLEAAKVYAEQHPQDIDNLANVRRSALARVNELGLDLLPGKTVNLLAVRNTDAARLQHTLRQRNFDYVEGPDFGAPGVVRLSVTKNAAILDALTPQT